MPADSRDKLAKARERLIGLGRRSISKSYYPELKSRLDELEHFRALLDRVSDAIFVVDAETGIILDISGSTPAMLDCESSDLVGTLFKNVLPPHVQRHSDHLINSETNKVRLETDICCPSHPEKGVTPVDMTLQTVTYKEKRQVVIVARDITERRENEATIRRSYDLLEERVRERTVELNRANKAKSEFLSVVSHELRTPLTSLLGFAKIIRKKLNTVIFPILDESEDPRLQKNIHQIRSNIDIIATEGDRLTALINDVLDLAKMEANKVEYRKVPIAPEEFIQRSVQASIALLKDSELTLDVDIEPGLPMVDGDLDRLIQVMVNLLSNAVKFTSKGAITCRARLEGKDVRVSVSDTGIGIPESMQESVFEEFTQGEESLTDRPRGTGLGLPICRNIINGHDGRIWVESRENKGSTFVFTLPVLEG